jgi:hypothetical protein
VGETGGETEGAAAKMGAETLRDALGWMFAAALVASSLSASVLMALRKSSRAGLVGTFFAGLGARTRSTERGFVVAAGAAAAGTALLLCVARGEYGYGYCCGGGGLRGVLLLASEADRKLSLI